MAGLRRYRCGRGGEEYDRANSSSTHSTMPSCPDGAAAVGLSPSARGVPQGTQASRARLITAWWRWRRCAPTPCSTPARASSHGQRRDPPRQLRGRLFTFLAVLVSTCRSAGGCCASATRRDGEPIARPSRRWRGSWTGRWERTSAADDDDSIDAARQLVNTGPATTLEELGHGGRAVVGVRIILLDGCRTRRRCAPNAGGCATIAAGTRPRTMRSAPSIWPALPRPGGGHLAGVTAFTTLLIACSFWILKGWPERRAGATILVVVFGLLLRRGRARLRRARNSCAWRRTVLRHLPALFSRWCWHRSTASTRWLCSAGRER